VNVWSHIGGVALFIALFVQVCIAVIPNQLWYNDKIEAEYSEIMSAGLATLQQQDPVYFLDT